MKRYKRHPADVTADRLLDHVEKWYELFEPDERDDLSRVRFVLQQIADGERRTESKPSRREE